MHFLIVIYTACNSLAKWWGLFLGTSRFEIWKEGRSIPPLEFVGGGGRIPPGITNIFKKIASLSILDGFENLYISGSAMTYTIRELVNYNIYIYWLKSSPRKLLTKYQ